MATKNGETMADALRVLLVDDSDDDVALMLRALRDDRRAVLSRTVQDATGMQGALEAQPWDVILCDSSMPQFGAHAALQLLREMALETPLIVVSGSTDERARAAALSSGAKSVVAKSDLTSLRSVVEKVCKKETPLSLADERAAAVDAAAPEAVDVGPLAGALLGNATDDSVRNQLEEIARAVAWATTLSQRLLASSEGARPSPSIRPRGERPWTSPPPAGRATVLVVEDDDALRTETCRSLQDAGYAVFEAKNAGEVLLLGRQRLLQVKLVLAEVLLPRFNALELLEALRAAGLAPKVIFTASKTEDAIVHYGVINAGLPFLAKPWTSESLARAIEDALGAPEP